MITIVTAEKLAYWYFRLNGFMTIENFILHNESRRGLSQRTDADICGVRFPFREELNMQDAAIFLDQPEKPLFIIAEITAGECKLNGPWTNPNKLNMQYVLKSIGSCEPIIVDVVANDLYEKYSYEDGKRKIQLLTIGSRRNEEYVRDRPTLPQILFSEVLTFIYERLHCFIRQKRDHKQWDATGKFLYEQAKASETTAFISSVSRAAGISVSDAAEPASSGI